MGQLSNVIYEPFNQPTMQNCPRAKAYHQASTAIRVVQILIVPGRHLRNT